jgi:hypothetical protein
MREAASNRIISLSGAYYEASQEIIAREKELSHLNVWMTVLFTVRNFGVPLAQ